MRCPFGVDWEKESAGHGRLDRLHRIPFWLALMEMYGDVYRYGSRGDRDMPYVLDTAIERSGLTLEPPHSRGARPLSEER